MTILQGTMQDGTVLPVQVDSQGRLVAEGIPGKDGIQLPPNPVAGQLLGWNGTELAWFDQGSSSPPNTPTGSLFETALYTGNGGTQTITNGIDLASKGGMVWLKARTAAADNNHTLCDTERGINTGASPNQAYRLSSSSTNAQDIESGLESFASNGFSLAATNNNQISTDYVSWTFRKSPGFFDVVTYTGTGVAQEIPHNLGSVPGCIMLKNIDAADHWVVYHQGTSDPANKALVLNEGWAENEDAYFNGTAPTNTQFSVGAKDQANRSGSTFVAYLFASDDTNIKCGRYTGNDTTQLISCGFDAGWVMIKKTNGSGDWAMYDVKRGDGNLNAQEANVEVARPGVINFGGGGFTVSTANNHVNNQSGSYIYIAIRDGG